MCSDIVSRLPNEVSNYELCYFLHSTGCDRGKEGTQREEEGEEYRENNGFDRDSESLNKKKRKRKQQSEQALITDAALEQHQLYSAHNYLSF